VVLACVVGIVLGQTATAIAKEEDIDLCCCLYDSTVDAGALLSMARASVTEYDLAADGYYDGTGPAKIARTV